MHDCFTIELTGECLKCLFRLTGGVPAVVVQSEALWARIPEIQVRIPSRAMVTFFPHTVSSIFRLSLTHRKDYIKEGLEASFSGHQVLKILLLMIWVKNGFCNMNCPHKCGCIEKINEELNMCNPQDPPSPPPPKKKNRKSHIVFIFFVLQENIWHQQSKSLVVVQQDGS